MKKFLSIILTIFMMFSIGTTATACNKSSTSTSSTKEETNEQKVRKAVNREAMYYGGTMNGDVVRYSSVSITYLRFASDGLSCSVGGKITVKDSYDTRYSNTFDCKVTTSDDGETWKVSSFEVKRYGWSKLG